MDSIYFNPSNRQIGLKLDKFQSCTNSQQCKTNACCQGQCLNETEIPCMLGPITGGKTKDLKATDKRVVIGNTKRVVYEGSRGGQYIKKDGKFVSLKSMKK